MLMQPTGGVAGSPGLQTSIGSSSFTGSVTADASSSTGRVQVQIRDSIFRYIGGGGNAVVATAPGSAFATVQIVRSEMFGISNALTANGASAFIDIADTAFTNITNVATSTSGGTVTSFANNPMYSFTNIGSLTTAGAAMH